MPNDMTILTKTFDMLDWLLPQTERFPKTYRFTVTRRISDAAMDFQEALFEAQSQGGSTRQKHLRQADAALNKLRLYLRLIHRWRWITPGQYQHISRMITELGRLLGGWIKAK